MVTTHVPNEEYKRKLEIERQIGDPQLVPGPLMGLVKEVDRAEEQEQLSQDMFMDCATKVVDLERAAAVDEESFHSNADKADAYREQLFVLAGEWHAAVAEAETLREEYATKKRAYFEAQVLKAKE